MAYMKVYWIWLKSSKFASLCPDLNQIQNDLGNLLKMCPKKDLVENLTKRIKTKIKGTELIRKHLFMVIQFHSIPFPSARRSEERME